MTTIATIHSSQLLQIFPNLLKIPFDLPHVFHSLLQIPPHHRLSHLEVWASASARIPRPLIRHVKNLFRCLASVIHHPQFIIVGRMPRPQFPSLAFASTSSTLCISRFEEAMQMFFAVVGGAVGDASGDVFPCAVSARLEVEE